MKKTGLLLLLLALFSGSCEKDEFTYDFPELDQLLISITRTTADAEFKTEFKYDSLNRLEETQNIYSDGQSTVESYFYNEAGKIEKKIRGSYMSIYSYNSKGQVIEENMYYLEHDNEYERNTKTEFKYKNGKISKGIIFSAEGKIMSYISYKYDSRGNMLEKTVRTTDNVSDFILSETNFRYDKNVNPHAGLGMSMFSGFFYAQNPDLIQVNNPVYYSYENVLLSSIPPVFEISYEYALNGLPIKATLNNIRFSGQEPINVVYEYRDITN